MNGDEFVDMSVEQLKGLIADDELQVSVLIQPSPPPPILPLIFKSQIVFFKVIIYNLTPNTAVFPII